MLMGVLDLLLGQKARVLSSCVFIACVTVFVARVPAQQERAGVRLRSGHTAWVEEGQAVESAVMRKRTALTQVSGEQRAILQFREPLTWRQRQTLRQLGVAIKEYIPDNTYIADTSQCDADAVASLAFLRTAQEFKPEWKVDRVLASLVDADKSVSRLKANRYRSGLNAERQLLLDEGKVKVTVTTFANAQIADVVDQLSTIDGFESVSIVRSFDRVLVDAVVPLSGIHQVSQIPQIQFIEDAPQGVLRNRNTGPTVQSGAITETPIWDQGLHGEGQIIGLIDSLPFLGHQMFFDDVPVGPDHRKFVAWRNPGSTHSHGTFVAGVLAGDMGTIGVHDIDDGVAFAARISYSDYFNVDAHPSTLIERLTDAHNDGAHIHSNSWGDDNTTSYTTWCRQADEFSYNFEEDLVCFSVTNDAVLRTPENAKNVLAVGASAKYPNHNDHCLGGVGPTADGRRKPEVFAPGCSVRSAATYSSVGMTVSSGTSYSSPAVAACAALVRQYFIEGYYPNGVADPSASLVPSGALMKAVLLNATMDMTGVSGYPSDREGWGRLQLDRALCFFGANRKLVVQDVRNAMGLVTGESSEIFVTVLTDAQDLRVTMVFTDPPASVSAADPIINDLDLIVTRLNSQVPGGSVFRGNYFKDGQSMAGGVADEINNVEQVYLPSPVPGVYSIAAVASAVNSIGPQGYALVVTGDVLAGASTVAEYFGDYDSDGDVDLADYSFFQTCFSGSGHPVSQPACQVFDSDGDNDIDEVDLQAIRYALRGPN